jgi:lysophospholipase L1-like esterase
MSQTLCITVVLLLWSLSVQSQAVQDSSLAILRINPNQIENPAHLAAFYEKLYQLKTQNSGTINIIHIGDSHIQADFLTDVVRKSLQREFGNAGRGLVVPGRVAGTNEPLNFRTSSSSTWASKRVAQPSKPYHVGVGGITITTTQDGAALDLKMTDTSTDYSFNTVGLFFEKTPSSFSVSIQDSSAHELQLVHADATSDAKNYSEIVLPTLYKRLSFRMVKTTEMQRQATLFGLNLNNGKPGVVYHAIGVNGAKYEHYNQAKYFAEQTKFLKPDLIIISLGTNESVEYPNINQAFPAQISNLVTSLSKHNPDAVFVLVTPPDAFLKKIKANPGIEKIRMSIIQYAVENGLAFWDMFKVFGGKSSAIEWKMRGLLRPDGIHFSREGYAHQGSLLFEAIMRGYNKYVFNRQQ